MLFKNFKKRSKLERFNKNILTKIYQLEFFNSNFLI